MRTSTAAPVRIGDAESVRAAHQAAAKQHAAGLDRIHFAGSFQDSSTDERMEILDPTTLTSVGSVPVAHEADVAAAVDAARRAQREWGKTDPLTRAATLRAFADAVEAQTERLAMLDTLSGGFPLTGMRHDVSLGVRNIRYAAGLTTEAKGASVPVAGGAWNHTRREPYGVVARLTPYNHPVFLAAHGISGPVSMGNAVIIKPADQTPHSALLLAQIAEEFFPAGLVNVITGPGPVTGDAIIRSRGIPRVAFTGSVETGRAIYQAAAARLALVSRPLGGKNPGIVAPDAVIESAARQAVTAMNLIRSQGQSCGSPSQIFVHADVHDEFVEAVRTEIAQIVVGDPLDEATQMGPIAFQGHRDRVLGAIGRGVADGARLVCGATGPAADQGLFVAPAVFVDVSPHSDLASREIFGPVMSILRYTDLDEVVRLANRLDFGLGAYVWTSDLTTAMDVTERLQAGYVWVNGQGQRPPGAPFGGWGDSGIGVENSLEELLSYTQLKNVYLARP